METVSMPARIGGFNVVRRIARGGYGTVYHARGPGGDVAVKLYERTRDPDVVEDSRTTNGSELKRLRLAREQARAQMSLRHPNVVKMLGYGRTAEGFVVLMDLVRGWSLREILSDGRGVPPRLAIAWFLQIISALDHAHARGIVHGDLKPANVLVCRDLARVQVTDFGGAAGVRSPEVDDPRLPCTRSYAAPEVIAGERPDARSDVYSAGLVLAEMLGQKVWDSGRRIRMVLLKCLAARPEARPQTARQILRVLTKRGLRKTRAKPRPRPARSSEGTSLAWLGPMLAVMTWVLLVLVLMTPR